jgi:predicted nucleic acid-binding protein
VIFVDTGAWFASLVPWDADHASATSWLAQNREELVTTDYVADETLTLLRSRQEGPRAERFGTLLFSGRLATLRYLTVADIADAWQLFLTYRDKEWSFTDCTSKVVMERLGITTAFAYDQHFRQFGSVAVVP